MGSDRLRHHKRLVPSKELDCAPRTEERAFVNSRADSNDQLKKLVHDLLDAAADIPVDVDLLRTQVFELQGTGDKQSPTKA